MSQGGYTNDNLVGVPWPHQMLWMCPSVQLLFTIVA